jgi:hypothetical protein
VSYLSSGGRGLTLQAGIFSSLIGYDSLYAKDNFAYTRPWGADYTPYLMLGVNATYPVTDRVTATFAVVNGYWHLGHANDAPNVAGQIVVKPAPRTTVKQTVLYGSHQANTALEFWRVLSDTIVEHKRGPVNAAFEYQIGAETVDVARQPRALWMAAQAPVHWQVRRPWSVSVRPELAWDRDGRWIGAPQSVTALTTTLEYRSSHAPLGAIVRVEHRVDRSQGVAGGFFRSSGPEASDSLTPVQNLLTIAVIVTVDRTFRD